MNRISSSLLAGLLAATALGTATVAEARPDVYFSVGIQSAPVWVEPAPVYVRPRPVYVLPAPVYIDKKAYKRERWGGYDARAEWERERAWRHAEWLNHQRHEGWRDGWRDGDRYDGRGDDAKRRRHHD